MTRLALRKRFTCFQKLPLEVRLLIWEAALPGPRLVSICQRRLRKTFLDYKEEKGYDWPPMHDTEWNEDDELSEEQEEERRNARRDVCLALVDWFDVYDDMNLFWQMNLLCIASNCSPPNITYVCHEAYRVVARYYTKAFAYPDTLPGAYINLDNDILYLREEDFSLMSTFEGSSLILQGLKGHFAITDIESLERVRSLAVKVSERNQPLPQEDFLCKLLEIFKGVEEISIVARDYNTMVIRDYPPDPAGQECLIDPVDASGAIRAYSTSRQRLLAGSLVEVNLPLHWSAEWLKQSAELAKQTWEASREPASSRRFPNIRVVNIVPQRLKRDLDQAKALYEQALETYRINEAIRKSEELHAAGFCTDDALSDDDF
ncbi:hypothetical protein ONS95_004158 [Cadophora gregata]|uniref:uncharacterized protein n=1 Tax=Cadophora gregata TaxID=51156 RepID=UPI0026DDA9CF|nr:uncharacterized protein ONS95_004158 [Cadophora gregata]KAK0105477.1 hypothetical protein ONS96_004863 [Cadophora gregata f. sp. sojae]KAK0105628.1 hypothetical protein ONS95_004158 [Cadophora gregata]